MDLSGFNTQNGFGGDTNASPTVSPQAQGGGGGLLSRVVNSFISPAKYFLNTDIVNPVKELAAQATGNKTAFQNAKNAQQQTIGATPGEAIKRLAGNTAQLATMVLAPEAKAGIGANIIQGAKVGAVSGGGSAAANDQDILKGAIEGGITGGVINPIANGILSKVLPKGAAPEATNATDTSGNGVIGGINNHLQQTEAATGGFNAGAKLPGSGPNGISLNESQNLSALSQKYGIPSGSPATRLRAIQSKINDALTNLHNTIADNNVPVAAGDRQDIVDEFNNRIANQPNAKDLQSKASDLADHLTGGQESGATIGGQPLSPEIAKQLGVESGQSSVNDLQALNAYRQKLDGIINYSRSQGSPNPLGEQAATILRQTISDHIGNMSPEVAAANKTFSELKSLEAPTLDANNQMANQGGGLYNRLINNSVVKGVEAKAANIGQKMTGGVPGGTPPEGELPTGATPPTGNPPPSTPGVLSKVLSNPQIGSYLQRESVVAPSASIGNQPTSSNIPTAPGEATAGSNNDALGMGSPNTTDTLGLNGATPSSATSSDPFSEESIKAAILQDIQTNGGKNVAALTSLYNTFGKTKSAQSTAEKNTVDTLNSALATLGTYNDQLNASGGGRGAVAGNFYNALGAVPILGSGSTATNVRAIESQKTDVATSIAKALTGGKPSSAQIKSWENAIPNVTDSPQVARQKMANITASIQSKLATYPGGQ